MKEPQQEKRYAAVASRILCGYPDRTGRRQGEQGLEQGLERGFMQGLAQGLKQEIKTLIEVCREFNLSREKTADKIKVKYALSSEQTEEYMKENW